MTNKFVEAVTSRNPRAYWRLDEMSGTTVADQTGDFNATMTGTVTRGGAPAAGFDGASAAFTNGHFSPSATPFTGGQSAFSWVWWMKTSAGSTDQYICSRGNVNDIIYGFSSQLLEIFSSSGGFTRANTTMTVPADGEWHQVAYTYDGTTLRGYVDGVEQRTHTQTVTLGTSSTYRWGRASNDGAPFIGSLDEVAVFDYALTANDIAEMYDPPTPPDETSTSTETGPSTGTGTTSTGPAARLTPLNLFLVTLRLPDEPVEDPAPAEALPDLPDVSIGLWDFTGATATRFQDIAGTTESTDRVGRVNNIIASGQDLIAPDATRRLEAIEGFAQGTSTVLGGLLTNPFTAISGPFYFAIKFRSDGRSISGTHLINARFLALSTTQSLLVVESSFSNDPPGGAGQVRTLNASFNAGNILSGVGVGSGDHVVELLIGGPSGDQYALDGGDWVNSTTASIQGQLVQISISHDMADTATTTARRWVGRMYRLAADTGIPTAQKRQQVRGWLDSD